MPSTSEWNGVHSTQGIQQFISVKSPEKLLTSQALKEYKTPEKQSERVQNRGNTSSSKRILFDERDSSSPLKNIPEVNKGSVHTGIHKTVTPKKQTTPIKNLLEEKTPAKGKKTPKKLFEKSPNNLNNFNVQVIDSFIKLTPSKSSVDKTADNEVIFVKSTEKKQSSILKYMSPSPSPRSLQAQNRNECTPTRPVFQESRISLSTSASVSKVKAKLNFSSPQSKNAEPISQMNGSNTNVLADKVEKTDELKGLTTYNFDDSWDQDLNEVIIYV